MKQRVAETIWRGAAIGLIGLSLHTLYKAAPDAVDSLLKDGRGDVQRILAKGEEMPEPPRGIQVASAPRPNPKGPHKIQPPPPSPEEGLAHNKGLLASNGKNIYMASWDGDIAAVREILIRGPYLNLASLDEFGGQAGTPLYNAVLQKHHEVAKMLLEHGADSNIGGYNPPLREAARYGDIAMVDLLLAKGANPDTKDSQGWTPLMLASYNGNVEVMQRLLSGGADPNYQAPDGKTPLSVADSLYIPEGDEPQDGPAKQLLKRI